VLEQLDLLGEEVVPVLRKEFAALKPAHVPDAPTHASLVAARGSPPRPSRPAERGDDATVEVVELREHARDLADNLLTGFPPASLRTPSTRSPAPTG
jgi:hypothetical protein